MNSNLLKITDNVEGETKIYQHKFHNLEKSLKDLSEGGLFQQIDSMVQEVRRLTMLNEKYELRFFLVSLEVERRGGIINDYLSEVEKYRATLKRKDSEHVRELEKIRDEETNKLKYHLQQEIENLKHKFNGEKAKLDKRLYEQEIELGSKIKENNDLVEKINQHLSQITNLRYQVQDLNSQLSNAQKYKDLELSKLRAEHQQTVRDIESRFRVETDALRNHMAQERSREIENARKSLIDKFNEEMAFKDSAIGNLKSTNNQSNLKLKELEAEIVGLNGLLLRKDKDLTDLRNLTDKMRGDYDSHLQQVVSNHQLEISQLLADKDTEANHRLASEAEKFKREVFDKNKRISQLEQGIGGLEAELIREKQKGGEAQRKIQQLQDDNSNKEKLLQQQISSSEETLTITIEQKDSEITDLLAQIKSLHEMYNNKLHLEKTRGDNLSKENEHLKKENLTLQELSTTRKKEIEEWYMKYKDYLTPEEAEKLKAEIQRLRVANITQEDSKLEHKMEVSRLYERIKALEAEMETKNEDLNSLRDVLHKRAFLISALESEKDELAKKMRHILSSKDTEDVQMMLHHETELKLQQENSLLKTQRDDYQRRYEDSLTEIEKLNQKYSELLRKNEEALHKYKNPTQTSTHIVRTSQIITKNMSEMSQ